MGNGRNAKTNSFIVFFLRCPPTKVAVTSSVIVFLEPCITKTLVFTAFEHLLLGGKVKTNSFIVFFALPPTKVAQTISFTVFLEPCIKQPLVFIAFEHLLLGGNGGQQSRATDFGAGAPLTHLEEL